MSWQHDLGFQFLGSRNRVVEVVELEPEQDAVAVWFVRWIPDRQVVVLDLEAMELKNQVAVGNKPIVLGSAVGALTSQQTLVPAAARFNVGDSD